jgi:hypothetical protein
MKLSAMAFAALNRKIFDARKKNIFPMGIKNLSIQGRKQALLNYSE